jgi:hypothetical protein
LRWKHLALEQIGRLHRPLASIMFLYRTTTMPEGDMRGLMQDWPLLCQRVIDHAAVHHGERPVISRSIEGPIHATNYAAIRARALKVAQRLDRDGIRPGDRVATLAWNTWRHLEAWYGIVGIAPSITRSIRDCSPSRSRGSSIMPRIGCS